MVYHPYLRGKQYELITVRETAPILAAAKFKPIIEPVRESLGGLEKALNAVVDAEGSAVVIVNPHHGDLSGAGEELTKLLQKKYLDLPNIAAGILLKQSTTLAEALECFETHEDHTPVFVHAGFTDAKGLAENLGNLTKDDCHIFFDALSGKLYQRHFKDGHRVLLKDGFERKRNADYSPVEPFSDLHVTYTDEGMDGFGDFLIVGDDFTEGGGPAYAVAIHLTFIDVDQDEAMQIYHFVSDRQNTPQDSAGKFAEALSKMIERLDQPDSHVLETEAVKEFRKLHTAGHFPGLGYVKKLSMNHHISTLANYFKLAT